MRYILEAQTGITAIGGAVWAVTFGFLEYLLGSMLTLFIKEMKRYELTIVLTIIMIGSACWLVYLYVDRKNRTHNKPSRS